MFSGVSDEVCDTYYQLGKEEIRWRFPFCLIRPKHKSGLIENLRTSTNSWQRNEPRGRLKASSQLLNWFIKWLGLDHLLSEILISECLKSWLSEYKPELLYFQISNRESINFAKKLIEHLKIPSVIHMMDDWPSAIADKSICRSFWRLKINKELQDLLDVVDLHLSICDEMSSEYKRRYGHYFYAFHNTIDLEKWTPFTRQDLSLKEGTKVMLFSGRIGRGIELSLYELAAAIDLLNSEGIDLSLHIQSPRSDPAVLAKLKGYRTVTVIPPVEYNLLPKFYSQADILVIANDFNRDGIRFLKYSMPTKAPEYMISGTPVLVYASSETSLYKLFYDNKCGHCVAVQNTKIIADAIKLLLLNLNYRVELSRNAVAYANKNFGSKDVRIRFQSLLVKTSQKDIK
jgi:glycosyltransferase involved in cell wall biosynthesis